AGRMLRCKTGAGGPRKSENQPKVPFPLEELRPATLIRAARHSPGGGCRALAATVRGHGMIKICPRCRRTFSGGTRCLNCPEEVALLDLAEAAVRRAHLRGDGDLRVTIRTYYGARSAMLLQFVGILFGLAFAVALARKSVALIGGARWGMAALAAV